MENKIKSKDVVDMESHPKNVMPITIKDVATALQMSICFIQKFIHDGKLRIVKAACILKSDLIVSIDERMYR
jgi:hypothetical protein